MDFLPPLRILFERKRGLEISDGFVWNGYALPAKGAVVEGDGIVAVNLMEMLAVEVDGASVIERLARGLGESRSRRKRDRK